MSSILQLEEIYSLVPSSPGAEGEQAGSEGEQSGLREFPFIRIIMVMTLKSRKMSGFCNRRFVRLVHSLITPRLPPFLLPSHSPFLPPSPSSLDIACICRATLQRKVSGYSYLWTMFQPACAHRCQIKKNTPRLFSLCFIYQIVCIKFALIKYAYASIMISFSQSIIDLNQLLQVYNFVFQRKF